MRSPVRNIAKIVILALLTLLSIELVLRFVLWEPYNPWERYRLNESQQSSPLGIVDTSFSPIGLGELVPNQDGIWTFKLELPYHVKTNSHGFRNSEEMKEQDDVVRILAIGDSFTFGAYVNNEDTWTAWLETLLNRRYFPDVEYQVLNAGFPGYTITDEIDYMKAKGLAVQPDLVILNVTPNDVRDFAPEKRAKFARPNNRRVSVESDDSGPLVDSLRQFLEVHSAAFQLSRLFRFQMAIQGAEDVLQDNERANDFAIGDDSSTDKAFTLQQLYDEYLSTYEAHFTELVNLLHENDIPLLVVYFPTVDQLPDDSSNIQQENLAQMASANNVPFLDLLSHYRKVGNDLTLYLYTYDPELGYIGDGHPSRYGYYVSAEQILNFLADENLLPLKQGG